VTAGRISRREVAAAERQVAAEQARRADLQWSGYVKYKQPGRRGHLIVYPRGYDASSSSAIASWAARTVGNVTAEGATIVAVGMVAEVQS